MLIKFKKADEKRFFKMPEYATTGSSGADLFASLKEDKDFILLLPNTRVLIGTNLIVSIPLGYEAQIRSRSGLALKNGIMVLNSPGTIDSDFRSELHVILYNSGTDTFKIEQGMRIGQLVTQKIELPNWLEVEELDETVRGAGGFGSTGLK